MQRGYTGAQRHRDVSFSEPESQRAHNSLPDSVTPRPFAHFINSSSTVRIRLPGVGEARTVDETWLVVGGGFPMYGWEGLCGMDEGGGVIVKCECEWFGNASDIHLLMMVPWRYINALIVFIAMNPPPSFVFQFPTRRDSPSLPPKYPQPKIQPNSWARLKKKRKKKEYRPIFYVYPTTPRLVGTD